MPSSPSSVDHNGHEGDSPKIVPIYDEVNINRMVKVDVRTFDHTAAYPARDVNNYTAEQDYQYK